MYLSSKSFNSFPQGTSIGHHSPKGMLLKNKNLWFSISIGLFAFTFPILIQGLTLAYADFKVAAVGDLSCDSDATKTVQGIQQFKPNITLFLGDLSYKTSPVCFLKLTNSLINKLCS